MIFRNDDVSSSTDLIKLSEIYCMIKEIFPQCEIWSCVTLFGQLNSNGSVYKDIPFKHKESNWFYEADSFLDKFEGVPQSKIASHGLYHVDHSRISFDAQEMSIVGSCRYLNTDIFVPPFNRYDVKTEIICNAHEIQLTKRDGWKSLEFEAFNPDHSKWYFHSWRIDIKKLKEVLSGDKCLKS